MIISEKNGVRLSAEKELFVDAFSQKGQNILVTHAHSDHCRLTMQNEYFMTPETFLLSGAKEGTKIKQIPLHKKFEVNGFEVSAHSSGHILGSCQFLIANGSTCAITSDFKLQESLLTKPAEILSADTLLIETTFGVKDFSFPSREKVYSDLSAFCKKRLSEGKFIVLGGYSAGKAQELTKFSNEYLGVQPLTHKSVFEKNKLAEKTGAHLGGYLLLDHNLKDSQVLIMPPHLINNLVLEALSLQLGKKVECAVATGWKKYSSYKTFPLSDHADFESLLHYVRESAPKFVLTYHGFAQEFAQTVFRELGIPAKPLEFSGQKTLAECFGVV